MPGGAFFARAQRRWRSIRRRLFPDATACDPRSFSEPFSPTMALRFKGNIHMPQSVAANPARTEAPLHGGALCDVSAMAHGVTQRMNHPRWADAAAAGRSLAYVEGGTYKIPSCRIGVVTDRLTVKSGSGPALLPLRMQTTESKRRENSGVADHAVDDATLACAGLAGQDWAQREIWFRFAPMIYAFLRRTLGARHDPEDLLQEVFLRVFDRLGTLENPAALRSFVSPSRSGLFARNCAGTAFARGWRYCSSVRLPRRRCRMSTSKHANYFAGSKPRWIA